MKRRRTIYVAGPLTRGCQFGNVAEAIDAAEELHTRGWAPVIPHLGYLWHMVHPKTYEAWLEYDFGLISYCTALVRLPGDSPGSDREVAFALGLGIPVYFGVENVPSVVA